VKHPQESAFGHLPRLDGFRGISILLVLVGHEMQFPLGHEGWGALGGLGVLLFFVLSGFLITLLLLREQLETSRIDLGAFYVRRALRILPAFFVLIVVVCVLMVSGWVTDVTWGAVLGAWCPSIIRRQEGVKAKWTFGEFTTIEASNSIADWDQLIATVSQELITDPVNFAHNHGAVLKDCYLHTPEHLNFGALCVDHHERRHARTPITDEVVNRGDNYLQPTA